MFSSAQLKFIDSLQLHSLEIKDVEYLIKIRLGDDSFQTTSQRAKDPVWDEEGSMSLQAYNLDDYFKSDITLAVCARKDELVKGSCTFKLRDVKLSKEKYAKQVKIDKTDVTVNLILEIKENCENVKNKNAGGEGNEKGFWGGIFKLGKKDDKKDLSSLLNKRSVKTEQDMNISNQLEMIQKIKEKNAIKKDESTGGLRPKSGNLAPTINLGDLDVDSDRKSSAMYHSPRDSTSVGQSSPGLYRLEKNLKESEEFLELMKNVDIWKTWKSPADNSTLLHRAVMYESVESLGKLLEAGLDPNAVNKTQSTPLLMAAALGSREMCLNLLGNGAKITVKDIYGYAPLGIAMKHRHFHLLDDLLLFGGDINNKRDNGMTILHEALNDGNDELMNVLLKVPGLKLNIKDQNGKTPLLRGCEHCPTDQFVKFLNLEGVDTSARDDFGRSFFNLLVRYGRLEILDHFPQDLDNLRNKYSKLLVEQDTQGKIPLHHAVEKGNLHVLKSLLFLYNELKLDFDVKDDHGLSPYGISFKVLNRIHTSAMKLHGHKGPEAVLKLLNQDTVKIEEILRAYEKK